MIQWSCVFPADLSPGSEAGSVSPYGTNQMMIQRTVSVFFLSVNSGYNFWQGFLAAPRMVWGNVINAFATIRAAKQFFNAERKGTKIAWDKTKHYFPSALELSLHRQSASSNVK
jgi:hypothetical protein